MQIKNIKVGAIDTNCYIVKEGNEILIIDPGGDFEKIVSEIDSKIKNITILNTHYHYDHTLVNNQLREKYNAKILIHEDEKPFINFKADKFLKNDDIVKIATKKLKVIHTPGHTQGGICLMEEGVLFSGDTLFENGYGRTDLPGGDDAEMFKTLQKLNDLIPNGTIIYPGHGNSFKWEKNV
jgi:hydroxyacylglutathione hydrolase